MANRPPSTPEGRDAESDLDALLASYRDRTWHPRLRLFAVRCCRRIWDRVTPGPGGRDAVETAERYALGRADRAELRRAAAEGAALVEAIRRRAAEGAEAGPYRGLAIRVFGTPDEYAALAAWSCTFSGRHPALRVPGYACEVVHLRRYREANRGRSRMEVWSSRAEAAGLRAAAEERAWQAAELLRTLGDRTSVRPL